MRLTTFWDRMTAHFGAQTRVYAHDHVLPELALRTVDEALAAGVPAREVWDAVCAQQEIPARSR